jgi:selenocysteine lyase/cysteine desulfurase
MDVKWDSYVFGAHKWLMSHEPLGVLVSRTDAVSMLPTYDTPNENVRFCSISMSAIAAFNSSLRMLRSVGLEHLWSRSNDLKTRFLKDIRERFDVLGDHAGFDGSLMLAVCPRAEFRWAMEADALRASFTKSGFNVLVLELDQTPWIRIAFPYFLDAPAIRRLTRKLRKLTVPK